MKIYFHAILFTIFLFSIFPAFANSFSTITIHWLDAIGTGKNINEPIFGNWVYSPTEGYYISKLRLSNKLSEKSFTRFLKETEFIESYWYTAIGVESDEDISMLLAQHPPVIDTKKLPKDIIAKVLNRRTPLLNNFVFDKTKFENDNFDPKYFCMANSNSRLSYIDVVWKRLIIMMCLSKDMRFEKEINGLLSYLMTPMPYNSDLWSEENRERYAKLTCGGNLARIPNICIGYLNLFRDQRGESRLNTGDERTWTDFEWSKYIPK